MAWDYARACVTEALKEAKGNAARAQRLLTDRALTDNRLLAELAAPHLKGILAHAVGRVLHEQTRPPEDHPVFPEALDMPLDAFGRDLLNALAGRNTARFSQEDMVPRPARKAASLQHIETIRKIARKTDKPT